MISDIGGASVLGMGILSPYRFGESDEIYDLRCKLYADGGSSNIKYVQLTDKVRYESNCRCAYDQAMTVIQEQ